MEHMPPTFVMHVQDNVKHAPKKKALASKEIFSFGMLMLYHALPCPNFQPAISKRMVHTAICTSYCYALLG